MLFDSIGHDLRCVDISSGNMNIESLAKTMRKTKVVFICFAYIIKIFRGHQKVIPSKDLGDEWLSQRFVKLFPNQF